ncbi:glycoside hydrolase family 36 protein [Paenibacillus sp. GCM10027626]|uniref:glycoside hydrolase family 36 protein n=1 Tax=Paenibacillus sp. GCM10027626 TaxID=3273411 RepID=UPI00362861B1
MTKRYPTIIHEGMHLHYEETDNGNWQRAFSPLPLEPDEGSVAYPHFQVAIAGFPQGRSSAGATGYSALFAEMRMERFEPSESGLFTRYKHDKLGLAVEVAMTFIPGTAMIYQSVSAVNEGDEPIVLTQLSSLHLQGIALGGCRPWHDRSKVKVHYCRNAWEGEGQWRSDDLETLGLFETSVHPELATISFSSVGSFSTAHYVPMIVIEDMETSQVWYLQIETSSNWNIEIGHRRAWNRPNGSLYVYADGANERVGGWMKELQPGERFEAVPIAYGCREGSFEDAVRELTKYRRRSCKPRTAREEFPIVYNDYMNALWGNPTSERLLPLIEAASRAGAECFCIDAGWFATREENWSMGLGDWRESPDRFGPLGLRGILAEIGNRGMIPGVWLEMEVCGEEAELGSKPDDWFLMRNGRRVGGGSRWFLNFANPDVRSYMLGVIDRLVSLGVGYIKNDYNDTVGTGADGFGGSSANGTLLHARAFYSFIDEVREKHPSLIIENCASGAMRQDYGILRHFHLQSFTDQEIYTRCPSILGGSLATVLPEQLGIWAYPYPLLHSNLGSPETVDTDRYRESMASGEQTIFNMVNGLCGQLYLSGRIDAADERNAALITEGVGIAKRERAFVRCAYPFWPIGFTRIGDSNSWASVGLMSEEAERMLLAVWRLGSHDEYMELPLRGWANHSAEVNVLYPAGCQLIESYYNKRKGSLTVRFPGQYQARLFEIKRSVRC